jgi:hypothetical protein
MMSPAIHATGMRPHPRRPAWHGVCSMHCGRASPPPSIFQPHDANVVKEPSTLRSSTQSPSNACPCPPPTLPVGAGVGCVVIIMPLHVVSCNFPWVIFFERERSRQARLFAL